MCERRLPVLLAHDDAHRHLHLAPVERLEPVAGRIHAHVALPELVRQPAPALETRAHLIRMRRGRRVAGRLRLAQPRELAHERLVLGMGRRAVRERFGDLSRFERGVQHPHRVERSCARALESGVERSRIHGSFREVACQVEERVREQHVEAREAIRIRAPLARERAVERAGVIRVRAQPVPLRLLQRAEQRSSKCAAHTLPFHPGGLAPAIPVEARHRIALGDPLAERRAIGRGEPGLDPGMQLRLEAVFLRRLCAIAARDRRRERGQRGRTPEAAVGRAATARRVYPRRRAPPRVCARCGR